MLPTGVNRTSRVKQRTAASKHSRGRSIFFMFSGLCVITQLFCARSQVAPTGTPSLASNVALAIQPQTETDTSSTATSSVSVAPPVTTTFTSTSDSNAQNAALSSFIKGSTIQHKVVPGEWMLQIARCYGADFNATRKANPQISEPNLISPDMIITVPNIGSSGPIYGPPCVGYHTVQSGDTWNSIALTYNADVVILQAANRGALSVGRVLRVPLNSAGGTAQLPTSSSATQAPTTASTTPALTIATELSGTPVTTTSPEETPLPTSATSDQLIDQALARNEIDSETALIYKVYAAYGDRRLPATYKGDDSEIEEDNIMWNVAAVFKTLSPSTQAVLRPFFIPPAYSGSWADQLQASFLQSVPNLFQWTSFLAITPTLAPVPSPLPKDNWLTLEANSHVKIWWQKGSGNEQAALDVLAIADKVWLKLVPLMGHEPLDDTGEAGDGGDKRLDIYLYPLPSASRRAQVVTFGGCAKTAAWMQVDPDPAKRSGNEFRSIYAHEFMHAIQYSFDLQNNNCEEYRWLMEATARWAEDYVYQTDNNEQKSALRFLKEPDLSLDFPSLQHSYGAYLFFFYLAGKDRANASLIRQIFFNAQLEDSLTAIENTIQGRGGFKEVWPDFALNNWNRIPVANYKDTKWDGLPHGAFGSPTDKSMQTADGDVTIVDLAGAPNHQYQLDTRVNHLAAKYYDFIFSDPNVRSVSFENPFFNPTPANDNPASVWALVKYANHNWEQPQDWTDEQYHNFCRDDPAERLDELVIIVSNSDWEDSFHTLEPSTDKLLSVNNIACSGWKGSLKFVNHQVTSIPITELPPLHIERTFVYEIKDATFTPPISIDNDDSLFMNYYLSSQQVTLNWGLNVVTKLPDGSECTSKGEFSMPFTPTDSPTKTPGTAYGVLQIANFVGDSSSSAYRSASIPDGVEFYLDISSNQLELTHTCKDPDGTTETTKIPYQSGGEILRLPTGVIVKTDGRIGGSYHSGDESNTYDTTYEFEPLPPK